MTAKAERVRKVTDDWYVVDDVSVIRFVPETREWRLTHRHSVAPAPFEMFDSLSDAIDAALESPAPFGLVTQ